MRARVALFRDPQVDPAAAAAQGPHQGMADSGDDDDVPEVPLEELLEDLAALGLDDEEEEGGVGAHGGGGGDMMEH